MTDSSPHRAQRRRLRYGIDREVGDRPATSRALLLDTDVAERRRWRCVHTAGDTARAPIPTPQWWLPDPRDRIVLVHELRAMSC